MAVITVRLAGKKPVEAKRRLAVGLTDVVAEVLGIPRDEVTILVEELDRENWAQGGSLRSERGAGEALRHDVEAFFRKPSAPVKTSAPSKTSTPAKTAPKKAPAKSQKRR